MSKADQLFVEMCQILWLMDLVRRTECQTPLGRWGALHIQ